MRGEYRGQRGVRPRDVCRSDRGDGAPGRLFVCVGCRSQALICSCCDRGQIYCADDCADRARHHAQRAAGRRYQISRRGRLAHAVRARRYRARGKKVTHQGSPLLAADDLVVPGSQAMLPERALERPATPALQPARTPELQRDRRRIPDSRRSALRSRRATRAAIRSGDTAPPP